MNPTWLAAADAIESAIVDGTIDRAHLVLDTGVAQAGVAERVAAWVRGLGRRPIPVRVHQLAPACPDLDRPHLGDLDHAAPAVTIVVGGGAVLDRVKLATLPGPSPADWPSSRSGLVLPPPGPTRRSPLVAVPTTLGTGAEASAVAVATRGSRRLLVMDRRLRPTAYAHDAFAYDSLPAEAVRHGLAEILSRLLGPYVGDPVGDPLTDELCLASVRRLILVGDRISGALEAGQRPATADLAEAARIGAFAHSDQLQRPTHPWSVKLWAIANECCAATGAAKMPTTAALWPGFWSAICDGNDALGSADRLRQVWLLILRSHNQPLPSDPGSGIAHLLSHWGAGGVARLEDVAIASLVERVVCAWGAGLPMHHGVSASSIDDVLRRCLGAESSGRRTAPNHLRPGSPSSLATH